MSGDAITLTPSRRATGTGLLRGDGLCLLLLAVFTLAQRSLWFGDPVALPLLDRRRALRIAPAVVVSVLLLALLSLPDRRAQSLDQREAAQALASAIAPHVCRDANCLWIWDGPTVLYRLTNSCVPTRFVYPDHLNNALETDALGTGQVAEISRILAAQPGPS